MMREIQGNFDKLHFTESTFGKVCFDGLRLRIPVKGIFLLRGHPLEVMGYGPYEGELIFDGVASSCKTITEYIGDTQNPTGFKPPREMVDEIIGSDLQSDEFQEFVFEGYQESPSAWIDDWIVRAKSFVLRV
jgi:hypothetical protein